MPDEENLAKQWERQRGFLVELPSGKKVRMVRTLDVMEMLKAGTIPNPLRSIVQSMIDQGTQTIPEETKRDTELLMQMNELMDRCVSKAVIDPKVYLVPEGENPGTWNPDDEHGISISDLEVQDKAFIYQVAQGGATDLEQFRKLQDALVASMADEPELSKPPKRASRSRKTGPVDRVLS